MEKKNNKSGRKNDVNNNNNNANANPVQIQLPLPIPDEQNMKGNKSCISAFDLMRIRTNRVQ